MPNYSGFCWLGTDLPLLLPLLVPLPITPRPQRSSPHADGLRPVGGAHADGRANHQRDGEAHAHSLDERGAFQGQGAPKRTSPGNVRNERHFAAASRSRNSPVAAEHAVRSGGDRRAIG